MNEETKELFDRANEEGEVKGSKIRNTTEIGFEGNSIVVSYLIAQLLEKFLGEMDSEVMKEVFKQMFTDTIEKA